VLDDVERRRFLVQPAREDPQPAVVAPLDFELEEGAGQFLIFPRRRGLAGKQPHGRVLDPHRLARLQRQVADDPVALVEEADDRDALGHRGHALLGLGRGLPAVRLAALLFVTLAASAAGKRERKQGAQGRGGAHRAYSGIQGS